MVISGYLDHTLASCLTEQVAFLISFLVLPRIFDNERFLGVFFAMSLPTSRRSAGYATCTMHYLVNNEALLPAIPLDLDEPSTVDFTEGNNERLFQAVTFRAVGGS